MKKVTSSIIIGACIGMTLGAFYGKSVNNLTLWMGIGTIAGLIVGAIVKIATRNR